MVCINYINIRNTINSGQVFLWEKKDGNWYGVDGDDVITINEKISKNETLTKKQYNFFRINDDIKKIIKNISKDKVIKYAVLQSSGLRILRQDPFQCFISFIISSNSNIHKIKTTLKLLCKRFGNKTSIDNKEFHLFPKPNKLANANISELLNCGLGYRARYIKYASMLVKYKKIDFSNLKNIDYQNAKNQLIKIYGVGDKVADCILLFSLEKLNAFPLDRWMIRILQKYYSNVFTIKSKLTTNNYKKLHDEITNYFGPYAGYAQQFLFKMERDLENRSWI